MGTDGFSGAMTASGVHELARSQRGSLHSEMEKLDRRGCGAGLVVRNIERRRGMG